MIKIIRKEDIPDWHFGDVAIKTYNYGDRFKIAGFAAKVKTIVVNGKKEVDAELREDVDLAEVSVFSLAAGIHYVKDVGNESFVVRQDLSTLEKAKWVYNVDSSSGDFLLRQIKDLTVDLSDDEKKN